MIATSDCQHPSYEGVTGTGRATAVIAAALDFRDGYYGGRREAGMVIDELEVPVHALFQGPGIEELDLERAFG